MEAHTDIEAHDEEREVIAQTCSRTYGDLVEELTQRPCFAECSPRARGVGAQEPYIPRIEEDGTVAAAEEVTTELGVRLELEFAHAVHKGVGIDGRGIVAPWAKASYREGSDTISTPDVELLDIRRRNSIAIGIDSSRSEVRSQRLHAVDAVGVAEVNGSLDELCKGYTEERLRVIVFTTEGPHRSIDEIPCLTDFARELHVVWAVVLAVGIGEAVADLGDELIAQAKPKSGVGEDELVEALRRAGQPSEVQAERRDTMAPSARRLEVVVHREGEGA